MNGEELTFPLVSLVARGWIGERMKPAIRTVVGGTLANCQVKTTAVKKMLWAGLLLLYAMTASATTKGKKFKLTLNYSIQCDTGCKRFYYVVSLPVDMEGRQRIFSCNYSRQPDSVYMKNGVKYASFNFVRPKRGERVSIVLKGELYPCDYATSRKHKKIGPAEDVAAYLQGEKWIESDSAEIKEQAFRLKGKTPEKTLENIFLFVNRHGRYQPTSESHGALNMLREGRGDCTEYSDLFVALCRASGLPARSANGVNLLGYRDITHSWAEVYMEPYGWMLFDPTPGNDASFRRAQNPYVWFSRIRNDEELKGYTCYRYTYWGTLSNLKMVYSFELL